MLSTEFFNRDALEVAPDLLGKYLVRSVHGKRIALCVNEVEAYDGQHDRACHGRFGKTQRTLPMFGPPGYFYVYLVYGMYWMLNIVVGSEGYPAAILIRGAGTISGPGRLTQHLSIDKMLNSQRALSENGLWFEDRGVVVAKKHIVRTPRIGIEYAGPIWSRKPYRFLLQC